MELKAGQPCRARDILEGESLFNDATTITLFTVVSGLLLMPASGVSLPAALGQFALALSLDLAIPHWYVVQSTVYGVALFSLVVQMPVVGAVERTRDRRDADRAGRDRPGP